MRNFLPINNAAPRMMHIDLNSCFAIIEAQANRLLRGRPVGVAAYDTPRGFVLAANYIAKAKGVVLGVNVQEARQLCPGIVIMTPDPSKYREAHVRFKKLLLEYSPSVVPKSIDEFVVDMSATPSIRRGMTMEQIGTEIKIKIAERLGEAVTVNIGIAPNRFLAKYAAGFNKPDGMTTIAHDNLHQMYEGKDLVDLPGINVRYKRRLWMAGIQSPLEFMDAEPELLQKRVFQSIVGYHWHMRLRGWEIDNREFKRKSIGQQYALAHKTADIKELEVLIMKLSEKTGRRLRKNGFYGTGIHLYLGFVGSPSDPSASFEHMHKLRRWSHGEKLGYRLYGTQSIYQAAKRLLNRADILNKVSLIAVTVFGLEPWDPEQLSIFSDDKSLSVQRRLQDALDSVNDRYGEYVITPATMLGTNSVILDRIAFGSMSEIIA